MGKLKPVRSQLGKAVFGAVSALNKRKDKQFDRWVKQAIEKLPAEDRFHLEKVGLSVQHDSLIYSEGRFVWAYYDNDPNRGARPRQQGQIVLISASIRMAAERFGWTTGPKTVDWIRRLLMHELGHARGFSDAEMAERFKY